MAKRAKTAQEGAGHTFSPNLPEETTQAPPPAETATPTEEELFLQQQQEELEQEGIESIPRLKIEQEDQDNLGRYYSEDVAQGWDRMSVVVLRMEDSRALFVGKFSRKRKPHCKSDDGIMPVPKEDVPEEWEEYEVKADNCASCPLSKWTTVNGEKVPPACKESKDILIIDTESMIPFVISFASLGLSAAKKQLLKPLKLRTMALSAQRKSAGLPPACSAMFSVELTTRYDERESGNSYQPVFSNLQELPDDEKSLFVQVAIATQGYDMHGIPPTDEDIEGPETVSAPAKKEKF